MMERRRSSWRRCPWLLLAAFIGVTLARPGVVGADVIPQGQKAVSYCAGVSNVGEFPDYIILAYEQPQNPSIAGSYTTITDATCKSLYSPATFFAMKRADYSQDILPADRNAQRSSLEGDPRVIRG